MKNIIITGGGFGNKGAEAMTYISVAELKKRFPQHTIYLYLPDHEAIPTEQKKQYAFEFLGWNPIKFARAQKNPLLNVLCALKNRREFSACNNVYKNTDLMVDISGYALGSNWSEKICSDYLDNIEFAYFYGIPVYLMPQSFGPFDFFYDAGKKIDMRAANLLSTVKRICAREAEGYNYLVEHYRLNNVELKPDLVLNNSSVDYQQVFRRMPEFNIPTIAPDSVCVIPNDKVYEFCRTNAQDVYEAVISELLSRGKMVYLMFHSTMDRDKCVSLKNKFQNEQNVIFLDQDYSCIEYNEIVKQFHYIVGSRFHSIVHALKNGIPCIALGWAVKYHDLLKEFGQETYYHDMRTFSDMSGILRSLMQMEERYKEEAIRIMQHIKDVQKENVFDVIG